MLITGKDFFLRTNKDGDSWQECKLEKNAELWIMKSSKFIFGINDLSILIIKDQLSKFIH